MYSKTYENGNANLQVIKKPRLILKIYTVILKCYSFNVWINFMLIDNGVPVWERPYLIF